MKKLLTHLGRFARFFGALVRKLAALTFGVFVATAKAIRGCRTGKRRRANKKTSGAGGPKK